MKIETVKVSVLRASVRSESNRDRIDRPRPHRRHHAVGVSQRLRTPTAYPCVDVLPEVHVHLATAIPNGYLVEYVPRSAAILESMPAMESGCLVAPKAPGLGLKLNQDAVRRFTYAS
jgi:hypothetical protein